MDPRLPDGGVLSFLFLGFAIGIRHALDADHVAAVVSLATRGGSIGHQARQGALWGLGHTLTLLLVAGVCISLDVAIPKAAERWFEAIVGGMLVVLGISVFRRLRRRGIHFHGHRHADGTMHFHAHQHVGAVLHDAEDHDHPHGRLSVRIMLVGAVHGLAGSAALVLLTAEAARSPAAGWLYVALFGLGSMLGMMAIAAAIAVPLSASARRRFPLYPLLCGSAGAFSVLLGVRILWTFVR
jgi:ABC-type nickel/cobalt efflux system permease component RcnA